MRMKYLYLALCVLGFLLPVSQLALLVAETGGFDFFLFLRQVFANRSSSMIAMDLLVTALASLILIVVEGRRLGMERLWVPIACVFLVGMSLGLPLFLYMRELHLEKK